MPGKRKGLVKKKKKFYWNQPGSFSPPPPPKVWLIAGYNCRASICYRDCIFPKLKYLLSDPLQKKCVHSCLSRMSAVRFIIPGM